ncbi:hypothetical protein SAMN04489752_0836 [Brevibacterium siliguriense]|uniref:Uncharacterized protein n=1 Tax=Brevibacterium siliguriense TaxID=1136497 RepID=A0A1H1NXX9_9MICO|nr:hypothetical protein [Brevibacterium siliguriense]SDS03229.1 hypothetical protein SAMN04489752_0836 [Brevibacterium siliguriense]
MSQPSHSLSALPASSATASAPDPKAPRRSVRILRRTIAIIIVVAFSLAAAGGIIVLLGDIESEATYKVIGTTALTGAVSVAAFCGATLIGRRTQWFGIVTIGLAVVTLGLALWFLWGDPFGGPDNYEVWDLLFKALSSFALLSAVTSVSSLILLLVPRSWVVRIGLPITLGLLTLGTSLVLITIWVESAWELEWLTRLNGIVWILAALGVVVVPLTSLLLRAGSKPASADRTGETSARSTQPSSSQPSSQPAPILSPSTLDRINAAARAEGITADELIDRLLTAEPRTPSADESR